MTDKAAEIRDSDDLESLFDSIVNASREGSDTGSSGPATAVNAASHDDKTGTPADKVINKVGHMTRALHDSLRELGYDKNLERAASAIPDARDRLGYVATMTQQAAEKVLNATEAAQPVVDKMSSESQRLAEQWQKLLDNQLDVEKFKILVTQTHAFLSDLPRQTKMTSTHLREIMMAQDFQDLTGQVIKKVVEVTQQMEKQLVELLVEFPPSTAKQDALAGLLNGPAINAAGRADIMSSQDQVDNLLESMGF